MHLETIDALVGELLKDQPDETLVKKWMLQVGLVYSLDPIQRMNDVLHALHATRPRKVRKQHETSV